jgi:hypothetical protein
MTRTVKYAILAIVAIPLLAVAAVLALLGTFSIAHSYKIGWVEAPRALPTHVWRGTRRYRLHQFERSASHLPIDFLNGRS